MGVPRGTYIRSLPRLYAVSWFGTGWFELCLTRTGEPKPSVCVSRIDIISGRSTAYNLGDSAYNRGPRTAYRLRHPVANSIQHLRKRLCIHSPIQHKRMCTMVCCCGFALKENDNVTATPLCSLQRNRTCQQEGWAFSGMKLSGKRHANKCI